MSAEKMSGPMDSSKMNAEGSAILKEMEEARKTNDLAGLQKALLKAKTHDACNQAWVDNALNEVAQLDQAAQAGSSSSSGGNAIAELAKTCKETGNGKLKDGTKSSLKEAIEQYTRGISIIMQAKERTSDLTTLISQLYNNRGQALLQLRDFSAAVADCKRCLKEDPKNVKAYFRGARASLLNGLYQQAIDLCEQGLTVDSQNTDLSKLREQAETKLADQQALKERLNISPQEIMDQQQQVNRLYQQHSLMQQQIAQRSQRRRSQELTKQYVQDIPDGRHCYVACGRAFIQRPQQDIQEDLRLQMQTVDEELPKIRKAEEEVKARYDKARHDLEEIVKHLPIRR